MLKYLKSIQLPCLMLSLLTSTPTEADWSQPSLISPIPSGHALGMDDKGNAMVIWNNTMNGMANDFYYNYLLKGQGWDTPRPLSSVDGQTFVGLPSIAIDASSNVVTVWEEIQYREDHNISTIKAGMHPSPGRWTVVDITSLKGVGQYPKVAISPSGFAVAVWEKWEQTAESPRIIQAATLQFGGDWSAPLDIGQGSFPEIVMDSAGNAVVAWIDQTVKSACLPTGGSWSSPTSISSSDSLGARELTLAINPSGFAVAAWIDIDYEEATALINTSTLQFGESWSPAVAVPLPYKTYFINALNIVVGNAGNATLVWQHEIFTQSAFPMPKETLIQSSLFLHKGKWTKPVTISPEGGFCRNPQVALDGSGTAYAVWNNDKSVQVSSRPFAGKWSAATDLSNEGNNSYPIISVDSTGYAVVVWQNSLGGIQSASLTP